MHHDLLIIIHFMAKKRRLAINIQADTPFTLGKRPKVFCSLFSSFSCVFHKKAVNLHPRKRKDAGVVDRAALEMR